MVNKVILQGRLVDNVELKKTQSDVAHCEVTVAWNEKYKDTETVCFLRVKAWRHNAEFLSKYFKKGQELVVEGKMVTEQWEDQDGNKKSRTICVADGFNFCGPKKDDSNNGSNYDSNDEPKPSSDDGFMQVPEGEEDGLPINF